MQTYTGRMLAVLVWLVAAPALAWTDTQVTSVSARIDARAARARVDLTLGMSVREGWLSRFELLDLGPELALEEPPRCRLVAADGTLYTPQLQLAGDSLILDFPDRRSAPRRGDYTLELTWLSRLPGAAEGEPHWSLPRWPERVANVRVEVLAARGARPLPARVEPHDGATLRDTPEGTLLTFVRAELPRTARFDLAWSLPVPARSRVLPSWQLPDPRALPLWLGAALALLWLLKWTVYARELSPAAAGDSRRQLLAVDRNGARRALASALGLGLSVALCEPLPLWAAALGLTSCLWSVEHSSRRAPAAVGGSWRWIDGAGCAFLDVSTPAGASAALLVGALLCWLHPLAPLPVACSACLAAALFLARRSA